MLKPAKPNRRNDGLNTLNLILDTAERLFAVDGYAAVSVRKITGQANVDLALVNYYFGSKEGLFREVLARRVDKMSKERLYWLEQVKLEPDSKQSIIDLLDGFIKPIIGHSNLEIEELRNYRLLIALVANSKNWQDFIFRERYDPVAIKYIDAFAQVLPNADRSDICWAFSFFLGSLVNALAETGRIDRLSYGKCRSDDLQTAMHKLTDYTASACISLNRPAGN
jgi:AcrR family transcriptional regulator